MQSPSDPRRRLHDLDALRAAAMLLGILYHAALSFAAGFPWMVQDAAQTTWPFVLQAWVHGFRMQLFMLVSGFFTAMLWRRNGLRALLANRFRRVLVPCLLGLVTVVPAMNAAVGFAFSHRSPVIHSPTPGEPASANLWAAIQLGDTQALATHLQSPTPPTNLHPAAGVTPIQFAALLGNRPAVELLLQAGSPVDLPGKDGHTALHAAAFMGHPDIVRLLLDRGANPNAGSHSGETPLHNARLDLDSVRFIAGMLGVAVDPDRWSRGRAELVPALEAAGAVASTPGNPGPTPPSVVDRLIETPVFILVWFLWFLVWLVGLFCLYAPAVERLLPAGRTPGWLLSRGTLAGLVLLTALPTARMEFKLGLGPDTSMGILPMPHVLAYYAIFFFFGALYHDCDDRQGRLGASWRWALPATILGVFPVALELATGSLGLRDRCLPAPWHTPASAVAQALFAWAMCLGCIGMFRSLLSREHPVLRYLSDSSYWLYLAHLPLCIAGQAVIHAWPGPAWLKLPLFTLALTAFLLLTYQFLVRHTWIGRILNGPRSRPRPVPAPATHGSPP